MDLKTAWKYLFNRKAIKEPKKVNFNTIKYFIQGNLRNLASNFGIVDEHILEQAQWRKDQIFKNSPECIKLGKCKHCECSINDSVLSTPRCDHDCYPEMMDNKEWQEYKIKNKIEF